MFFLYTPISMELLYLSWFIELCFPFCDIRQCTTWPHYLLNLCPLHCALKFIFLFNYYYYYYFFLHKETLLFLATTSSCSIADTLMFPFCSRLWICNRYTATPSPDLLLFFANISVSMPFFWWKKKAFLLFPFPSLVIFSSDCLFAPQSWPLIKLCTWVDRQLGEFFWVWGGVGWRGSVGLPFQSISCRLVPLLVLVVTSLGLVT